MNIATRFAWIGIVASVPLMSAGCSGPVEGAADEPVATASEGQCIRHSIEIGYAGGSPEWIGSERWDQLWETSLGQPHARICHAYVPWDVAWLPGGDLPAQGDPQRAAALRDGWAARQDFQQYHDRATSDDERCELMVTFKRHTAGDWQWLDGKRHHPGDTDPDPSVEQDLSDAFTFRDRRPTSEEEVAKAFHAFRETWPDVHVFESWNEWNNDQPAGNGFNDVSGPPVHHMKPEQAASYYLAMRRQCHPNQGCLVAAGALFATGPWTVTRDFKRYQDYVDQHGRGPGLPPNFHPEVVSYHPWPGTPQSGDYKGQTDELLRHLGGSWSRANVWLTEFGNTGDSGQIEDVLQFLYERPRITRWYYFNFSSFGCSSDPNAECAGLDVLRNRGDDDCTPHGRYQNPLLHEGRNRWGYCGAPDVRKDGSSYVLACASERLGQAPDAYHLRVSSDLVHWSGARTVFTPQWYPSWARAPGDGSYWCPEIYKVDDKWLLLFAATHPKPGGGSDMSIGQATADALDQRFTPTSEPLVTPGGGLNCGLNDGGSGRIDPTLLFDEKTGEVYRNASGEMYLYYVYQPRWVCEARVQSDGQGHLSIVPGSDHPVMLQSGEPFTATLHWEKPFSKAGVVEGVEAQRRSDGTVYLLYSGAAVWNASYAMGVAKADDPDGPFLKRQEPILRTSNPAGALVGPGHGSQWVTGPNGRPYLLYRVQRRQHTGIFQPQLLAMDELYFDGQGWPRVVGDSPQEGLVAVP